MRSRWQAVSVHVLRLLGSAGAAVSRLHLASLLLLLVTSLPLLTACGKRGDPLAPLPRTPAAVTGLRVAVRGDQLEVSYSVPRTTVGNVALPVLDVELWRADSDGDITRVGRMRSQRAAPGEVLVDIEPLPAVGTRVRFAARAISRGKLSALTAVVSLQVVAPPPPPRALEARLTTHGIALAWQGVLPSLPPTPTPPPPPPPTPEPTGTPGSTASTTASPVATAAPSPSATAPAATASVKATPLPGGKRPGAAPAPRPVAVPSLSGFFVYRRSADGNYAGPLAGSPLRELAYEDQTAKPGDNWCYVVRAVAATEPLVESVPSNESCLAVTDIEAPAPPIALQVQLRGETAHLVWSQSPEADLATYEVYRSVDGSEPESIERLPATQTSFDDAAPPAARRLRYLLRAVDKAGNWSDFSAPAELRR